MQKYGKLKVSGGNMQVNIDNNIINVEIIRKNNKNLYMRFKDKDTLIVTCNRFVREKEILKMIDQNKNTLKKMWISKEKEEREDLFFQYLGKSYTKLFDGITTKPYFDGDMIVAKDEKILKRFFKEECNRVFQMELNRILKYFPPVPQFVLRIRTMKTRWGVNNRGSKSITLNSELLKKDLDLIDYVIIHELCHFKEPNHSVRFWNHVEEYYPKYKEARKRLRGDL